MVYAPDTMQGGQAAARELLDAHPDLSALFTTNDLPALGAIRAAADAGIAVPTELSIVGITDIQLASEFRPALTTVTVPTVEAAEQAVALLDELIAARDGSGSGQGAAPRMSVSSEPRLVVRDSTGPARPMRD